MSCNCNETTKQGKQYCQECMPDEFHWLVPVSKEPDPFLMDRNHAYIDPNNIIYILSRDRLRAIKITTSEGNIDLSPYALKEELASKISELTTKLAEGLEGAKYFEGEGIRIDEDNRIHSTVTLTEVNQRLTTIETKDLEQDNKLTELVSKDIEQDGRLTALEYRGTDYRTEIITTVESYYEEPYKAMDTHGTFETTHHLRTNIGNYTLRDGIVFITIHRYVGETYDGQATVVGMFDEGRVSGSGLIQEHIVEMNTILSGNVKIHCELLNTEMQQSFLIYNIPNDSNEKYEISVNGFNFVPKQVLVPDAPMTG